MGYTTVFDTNSYFYFDKPVTKHLIKYINDFANTRHMIRDNSVVKKLYPNWREYGFLMRLGTNCEYAVNLNERDESILNHNRPSETQPGLWCQWVIDENEHLVWDRGEKFYHYEEWLVYLINNFFAPLGYVLNGDMAFSGEDEEDCGILSVRDNRVYINYTEADYGSLWGNWY